MKITEIDFWLQKYEHISRHEIYKDVEPYLIFTAITFLTIFILNNIIKRIITRNLNHYLSHSKITQLIIGPIYFFIIGGIIYLFFIFIVHNHDKFAGNIMFTVSMISFFRILYNLSDIYVPHLLEQDFAKNKLDSMGKTITKFILKITRTMLVVLCIITILEKWGIHVVTFLAGFGLVGMAVALAAQDTLKNLLSSVVIVADKTFREGDYIKFGTAEGVVENIGLRSTALRHPDKSLIIVPNSQISNTSITNLSQIKLRRLNFTLDFTYSTKMSVIKKVIERVRAYIKTNKDISDDPKLVTAVVLKSFNDYSIDVLCNLFIVKVPWLEFVKAREIILFDIMQIIEDEGADLAFPTQSVYLEKN